MRFVGYLEENSRFIQQFEQIHAAKQTMLQPWLVVNVMITFKGRQMRQVIEIDRSQFDKRTIL